MTYYGGHPGGMLAPDTVLEDFSGGRVNVPQVRDYAQLTNTESPFMRNVDTSSKSIRRMKGNSKVTNSGASGDVSSLYYDTFTGNVYSGYDTRLGKIVGNALTQLSGASGFTNNAVWSFCRVGNYILAVNGSNAPQLWNDGSNTLSTITTPPSTWGANAYPTSCANWMGRAFAFGVNGQKDILFYSSLYDVTNWAPGVTATAGGALTIGKDGIPITAIVPLASGLLVFKDPGLYYLTGGMDTSANFDQTKFNYTQINTDVDARCQTAVITYNDTVYAWGRSAVWKLTGSAQLQRIDAVIISQNISYDVTQVTTFTNQICTAVYPQRNQIWFSVAKNNGSTGIDTVHVYDFINNAWMLRDGYSHKCMANVRDSNGAIQIYSGGYSATPYVYQQNSTQDYDGNPMLCQWYSNWVQIIGAVKGRVPLAVISLGPQTLKPLTYTYAYDFATPDYASNSLSPVTPTSTWNTGGGSYWGTAGNPGVGTWQTGTGSSPVVIIFGFGRRMQHRFSSQVLGADFDIVEIKHGAITMGYK